MTLLPFLGHDGSTVANAISSAGYIVGQSYAGAPASGLRAVRWTLTNSVSLRDAGLQGT